MAKTTRGLTLFLVCVAGCEHADTIGADSVPAPDIGAGASTTREPASLSADIVERVDAPPPLPAELRRAELQLWYRMMSPLAQNALTSSCRWAAKYPCFGLMRARVSLDGVDERDRDPRPQMLARFGIERRAADRYCNEMVPAPACDTPLVVAFEGQAIQFANHWPTAETPWLALDRDGDGAITSRAELFGDATVLAGGRIARNGFEALAPLDDNGDGVVDARDSMFGKLLLWADRDGDRRSTPSELRLASEVVLALPLAHEQDARCTDAGDCEGERGTVHWRATDGSEHHGALVDVYLPR